MMNTSTERFIDKYEIVSTLGRGSMGVVYKGKDPEIGRLVAIKTLKTVFLGDDPAGNEALQRFRQESRSAGKLHHKNIVTIFEAGRTVNGSPYIVMEYIEGNSLEALIASNSALDPLAVAHYISQIADAVDYAHTQNVIHRDIKPSNILVDSRDKPFLLDFGVAKLSDTSLTPAGTVVGTPSYMSPEQIRGATLDGRTDLFSLAVVTFEAFTGVRPFPGDDFTTVVGNIINKQPLSFKELGVKLPGRLEEVLKKALSKDREQRYPTASVMATEVGVALGIKVDGQGIIGGYSPKRQAEGQWSSTSRLEAVGSSSVANGKISNRSIEDNYDDSEKYSAGVMNDSLADDRTAAQKQVSAEPSTERSSRRPKKIPRKRPYALLPIVAAILFVGLGAGYYLLVNTKANVNSTSSEQEAAESPVETSTENQPLAKEGPNSDVVVVQKNIPEKSTESTATPVKKITFTKETVAKISDSDLLRVLSDKTTDIESLRIAVAEAANRKREIFASALLPLVSSSNLSLRVSVLKAFKGSSLLGRQDVMDEIIKCVSDKDHVVRGFAAIALEKTQKPEVRQALERQLSREDNADIRKVLERVLKSQ